MTDHRLPSCCGSEDGDLTYGVDLASDSDVMVETWACHTCGVITITSVIRTNK